MSATAESSDIRPPPPRDARSSTSSKARPATSSSGTTSTSTRSSSATSRRSSSPPRKPTPRSTSMRSSPSRSSCARSVRWYFGRYADRQGRRAALTLQHHVMSAGSFVIAIMPTRATLGVLAAIILIVCRLVQGFATGGEYGTSATYMSEAATPKRRGFFSSFQYVTLVGGHVLAQLTLLVMFSVPCRGPGARLGLADPLRHRRVGRARGAVDAPHHGRVAVDGAARRGQAERPPVRCARSSSTTASRSSSAS